MTGQSREERFPDIAKQISDAEFIRAAESVLSKQRDPFHDKLRDIEARQPYASKLLNNILNIHLMNTMQLPVGFISEDFEKAKAYCAHFNCVLHKAKRGSAYNLVESADTINFFWLGANLNLQPTSSLTTTASHKYLS